MAADAIIFDGETNATVPAFIRLVRQKALAEGRERDDQWMAAFASSCIDGSALEWYETLDEEVQESWKLLRAALLSRWSRSESISSTCVSAYQAKKYILDQTSEPVVQY